MPAHKIYPTERSEGVGGTRLPGRTDWGRGGAAQAAKRSSCYAAGPLG